MDIGKDLVAASSAPLILGVLARGDSYGYAMIQQVAALSDGRLEMSEGLLYPLLHRLERLGQIEAFWGVGESGRRRRYYRITAAGRQALAEQRSQWRTVEAALSELWRMAAAPASGVLA